MSSRGALGGVVLALLAAAGVLTQWPPGNPLSVLILGLGALWIERFGLQLDSGYRVSPAAPVYLAMGLVPGVGPGLAGLALVIDSISRLGMPFWVNLAGNLAVSVGLLAEAILLTVAPERPEFAVLAGPALYLLLRFGLEGQARPSDNRQETLLWMQLHLRIRPLEVGLAAAAPVLAVACQASPLYALASLPILATTKMAAENVLLKSHDQTLEDVLKELKGARSRELKASRELDETRREKQLLEGFSAHIATNPSLASTARALVATVFELMPLDSAAVFLGTPPMPFFYRTSEAQTERLQSAGLTGLREPVVDRAWREKNPALQKDKPAQSERLLCDDVVAASVPLAEFGILYVARATQAPFAKKDLERLQWLSGKARLALEAGYQANEEARERRQQHETVRQLERKVAWLASLMGGAEAFASSLEREVLLDRFTAVLHQVVPHQSGSLVTPDGHKRIWGGELRLDPELLGVVRQSARALYLEDLSESRFASPGAGLRSLVAAPLLAHKQCLGVVLLASPVQRAFSAEQVDLVFLLSSQAAMALSNAAHFSEVVEARRRLEESQAQLVQSSKMTALGQLAAGVAHELNSPIGAIALCLEVASAQMATKPDMAARLLKNGQEALERSKEIINRLLTYSRRPSHQTQTICLADLTKDTLDFLSFQLNDQGVLLELETEGETTLKGEPQPLQQVLTNLILNGAQSMEDTAPAERRLTILVSGGPDEVALKISDRGTGIAEAHLARIFEPFFTTKQVGRGTGLGLWATHQIVTQHRGKIEVESREGEGSTFTVRLPREQKGESARLV